MALRIGIDAGGLTVGRLPPAFTGPAALVAAIVLVLIVLPLAVSDIFILLQLTLFMAYGILAMSLGWVWGYGGIFSFGQAAFYGLGGYTYAVVSINMGGSTVALAAGVAVPAAFALFLGYFMFYGRISTVYVAVITLVVSLIFYKFLGHTAGYEYTIGTAHLGGFNGMPALPPINTPGDPMRIIWPEDMFLITGICLLLVYVGLRLLMHSSFGRAVAAVRENELRAELLGYDTRFYKMVTFGIGGAVAGVAGVLYANWNSYVSPTVFDLGFSAQIIIWVVVGGLGTLVGPLVGAMVLGFVTIELGTQQTVDVNLILGVILVLFVLAVPEGVTAQVRALFARLVRPSGAGTPMSASPPSFDLGFSAGGDADSSISEAQSSAVGSAFGSAPWWYEQRLLVV